MQKVRIRDAGLVTAAPKTRRGGTGNRLGPAIGRWAALRNGLHYPSRASPPPSPSLLPLAIHPMTLLPFLVFSLLLSIVAGIAGALLGLGGGVIVVTALTLLLGIDIRYAIGASIVAVIATSSGAGASYVRHQVSNIRVGMFLELATVSGALGGAYLAGRVEPKWLHLLFAAVLFLAALAMWKRREDSGHKHVDDPLADRLRLHASYYERSTDRVVEYHVRHSVFGFFLSAVAGMVSGLLGIGGGVLKVPAMNVAMGLPIKVAAATSNFMIGVTAAAGAGVYFARGDIDPFIAAPVTIGVLTGAMIGARLMPYVRRRYLKIAFTIVMVIIGIQMLRKGLQ